MTTFDWKMVVGYQERSCMSDFLIVERYHWGPVHTDLFSKRMATIGVCGLFDGGVENLLYDKDTSAPHDIFLEHCELTAIDLRIGPD